MTGVEAQPRAVQALEDGAGATVLLLGLEGVDDEAWHVLTAAGLRVLHVAGVAEAVRALADQTVQVAITDARRGPRLIAALRARSRLAATHVLVCAALASADELRAPMT